MTVVPLTQLPSKSPTLTSDETRSYDRRSEDLRFVLLSSGETPQLSSSSVWIVMVVGHKGDFRVGRVGENPDQDIVLVCDSWRSVGTFRDYTYISRFV